MKVLYTFVIILIFSHTNVEGQKSRILQSNGSIETDKYHNTIAVYDDGYFILGNTEESRADLIVSKYDNCHDHLWTKRYDASLDLSVHDALVYNRQLVILMVTHFNSSTSRTPILLAVNMEGEIQFSKRYNKDRFDNFINLSRQDNVYHIFGPSTKIPDGGGHFVIDDKGDVISANVLINNLLNGGSDFGCTVLGNGTSIRRHRNTLINCDEDQNILWAYQFKDYHSLALLEDKPLALDDGFCHILNQDNDLVLFKMDYQGHIVWSIVMNGRYGYNPIGYNSGVISLLWRSPISENKFRMAYTEVDQSNGDIIENRLFENEEDLIPGLPMHTHTSNGDLILTGTKSIDGADNQDLVFINPLISECLSSFELAPPERIDLMLEDVTDDFETVPVSVIQTETSFRVFDEDALLEPLCNIAHIIEIDTSLDCDNNFVFDELNEGSEILWSDGRTDSVRTFTEPLTISAYVSSCGSDMEINLNIVESECNCSVFVPNIISNNALLPENRNLSIYGNCNIDSYLISIYDRWGNLVFQSKDINEPWFPNNSNSFMEGVYTWALEWNTFLNQEKKIEMGTITVLN